MRILLPLVAALGLLAPPAAAQTTVTLTPVKDTYLQDVNPGANFGASVDVWFGRGSFFGLGNIRTLVEFDLTSLPPHPLAIKSATFSAYQHSTEAAAGGLDCELHAATSPWTEAGATWNNQPAYDARVWDSASVGDSFYTGWIDWDATALVREHVAGSLTNLGWFFRMQIESAGASRLGYFHSSEYGADPQKRLRLVVELYDMLLSGGPLVASQVNTLTVENVRPGRNVFFAASRSGTGSHPVPQLGVVLELNNPTLIGSSMANGAGRAALSFRIPPAAAGRSVWIQACARNELSNWIADVVQ
jgi:hypothetical protein